MNREWILIPMVLVSGCATMCRMEEPDWLSAVQYEYASTGSVTVEAGGNDRYFVSGQAIALRDMCDIQEEARFPSDVKVLLVARPGATPADVKRARVVLRWQFPNLVVKEDARTPNKPPERD